MKRTIAIYGGSFNPPGLHHRHIAEQLGRHFDSVIVVPCGPRPDKAGVDNTPPAYRAAMADITFGGIPKVDVDLFDLEQATFTRTHELQARYAGRGEIWHAVGADLVSGGARGESFIQRAWQSGGELWKNLNFAVMNRPGHEFEPEDLPPRHRYIPINQHGSSFTIRELLFRGESITPLVPPKLAAYVERHGLYRGSLPARATRAKPKEPRLLIIADERNPTAVAWAKQFAPYAAPNDPNLIVVIGGDGTMLHAIHNYWRRRVPFFGVNAGHYGFLLNDAKDIPEGKLPEEIILRQMPMLFVEMQLPDGSWVNGLTFNDAWVERSTGQTAWLEVKVDGRVRLPKLWCDGALVSTAAASTAYARSMGGPPLLADTPAWLLVGSNVMQPRNWKSALLSLDAQVEITSLNPAKRPLNGFIYGVSVGEVRAMRSRVSRIATVELGFCVTRDMAEKITQLQFPQS